MTSLLRSHWEEGRAAWPTVDLGERELEAHLATLGVLDRLERIDAGGVFLACACARAMPAALEAFERAVLSQVPLFLARFDGGSDLADEVSQRLRERLLVASGERPRIATYTGEGPLGAWVRVAAVRTALDLLDKKDRRLVQDSDAGKRAADPATPEGALVSQDQQRVFQDVLEEAVSALPKEQRRALRMHFADGLTGEEIGDRLGISRATVTRWL